MAIKAPSLPEPLASKGYQVADETFKVVVSGGTAYHEVEIGDSKEPGQFMPQSKHLFFNNEANISLRIKDDEAGDATVVVEDEIIKYKRAKWEHHQRENVNQETGDFGFEHDYVLLEKPADLTKDYEVVYTVKTKGLDIIKQGELTAEEIAEGVHRPDWAVNSYHLYLSGGKKNNYTAIGGKNYATGKVGQIPRIKITDANGDWVYGDQFFDQQAETYTQVVPKEFLETAVYPVTVDPLLGYTTIGSSTTGGGAGYIRSNKQTTPASTTYVPVVSVYCTDTEPDNMKPIIFDAATKTLVNNGVGNAGAAGTSAGWVNLYFPTIPSLSASTDYYFGVIMDASVTLYYDAGSSGDDWYDTGNNYTTPTNPTGGGTDSRQYSIFATYTTTANQYIIYPHTNGYFDSRNDLGGFGTSTYSFSDLARATNAFFTATNQSNFAITIRTDHDTTQYWWSVIRGGYSIDTTLLSGKEVTDAKFEYTSGTLYLNGTEDDGNLHFVEFAPASGTSYANSDWGSFVLSSEGSINREDVVADNATLNVGTLGASFISRINPSGDTYLGVVTEADLNNTATWFDVGINSYNGTRINGNASIPSRWAYLRVTVSVSDANKVAGIAWDSLAKVGTIAKENMGKLMGINTS